MERCTTFLFRHDLLSGHAKRGNIIKYLSVFVFLFATINLSASPAIEQQSPIEGTVNDPSGEPLPGVSVIVKGTAKGTITDFNGFYTLDNVMPDATLVFSYIGMVTSEVKVEAQTTIDLTMEEDVFGLDEVVAIGYGTQKKINLTGSLSKISSENLESVPITNISSALQGTMAGVTVTVNNGQPGRDQGSIRVRGIGTLSNSDAMVLIDGIVSSMNDINPNDVESITVLKDAASSSIYGSRAANGVILVKTKQGKSGDLVAHFKMNGGGQSRIADPDFIDSWQSSTLYNEALVNEGKLPRYTPEEIQKFRDGSEPEQYPNTDFYKLFWKGVGLQQDYSFDVSGGSDKVQSYLSMGYLSQNGLVQGSGLDRYTARAKIDFQLNSHIELNANISYSQELFKEPVSNIHNQDFAQLVWTLNQTGRVVPNTINGYYGYSDEGNPIAVLKGGSNHADKTHRLSTIFQADAEIVKNLHFKPLLGYTTTILESKTRINDQQYYNPYTGEPTVFQGPNRVSDSNSFADNLTIQALLQYDTTFGQHALSILGGYSQEHYKDSYLFGSRYGYLNNALNQLDAGPIIGQQNSGNSSEYALQSLFGRINYSFQEKYLLEVVVRNDGSSRFAKENRWAIFPSASAGWRISQESFFEPLKNLFSNLKLRGSWGMLGNQNIGTYPYQATIATGQNYTFGGQSVDGIAPIQGVNPDIEWERTTTTNIGLDADLLNGKISFTGDYFIRNTSKILLPLPVANSFGLGIPVINAGSVENKGLELSAGYHFNQGDLTFDINSNISFIKNEITSLAGAGPFPNQSTILSVGLPINALYGLVSDGLFQSQADIDGHASQDGIGGPVGPGDIKYRDINGDNVIDSEDRQYLGTTFPKTTYGFTFSAGYKGFDALIFFQGASGLNSYVSGRILGSLYDKNGLPTSIWLDRWSTDNVDASFPRVWNSYSQNNPSSNPSSFWVRDASYLRLKNLQIGYTLPDKVTNSIGIKNARIFYSGKNLLTFTKFYKWVDPEAPAGDSASTYPMVKVNSIGLHLTF